MRTCWIGSLRVTAAVLAMTLAGVSTASADECVRGTDILATTVIYFDVNSTDVASQKQKELAEMAARVKGNPDLEVCTVGQADSSGSAAYNKKIALQRAAAVADVLKANGLQNASFQIKSRGESFSDDSWLKDVFGEMKFEQDRRVEVMIMTK